MLYKISKVPVFDKKGDLNVTCAYGWRIHPITGKKQFHNGVDCTRWTGGSDVSGIVAIREGYITKIVDNVHGYSDEHISGNYVEIAHADGFVSRYCHLQEESIPYLHVGDYVKRGTYLGFMGNTGRTTGIHLHFTLLHNNAPIDPLKYLTGEMNVPSYEEKVCDISLKQIRIGSRCKEVETVQRMLNSLGYRGKDGKEIKFDRIFGENTEFAVQKFQKERNLVDDGIVGIKTWGMLLK